jgi:e3 binding domain
MAQTTSQRSGDRRGKTASSRNGKGSATNRRRDGQDGARPAEQALHSDTDADREYRKFERREEEDRAGPPDVLLDVPELKVDLIHLEVDDLDAHVALKARVLNLVKLNVGVDVHLSRVKLDIKGVEAELVLKARLEHVAAIVDRLMTSLDRNPELVKGLSRAVSDIGQGAADAVDKTGDAAKDVGEGAQSALQDVGKGAGGAVGDVGEGAGHAVGDVGEGAGHAVGDVGEGAGQAVGSLARSAGDSAVTTPGDVAKEVARKVRNLGGRRDQRRAEKHHATQTATRVASELGVDLERLEGTGIDGRITVKDVREAQKA